MTALYIAALAGVFGFGVWAGARMSSEARRLDDEITAYLRSNIDRDAW